MTLHSLVSCYQHFNGIFASVFRRMWMNFYTEEQKVLCCSSNTIIVMKLGRRAWMYLAALWGRWKMHKRLDSVCVENLKGRHGCTWWDNFTVELKKVGCEYVDRICLAQNVVQWLALVNMAMSLWFLWKEEDSFTSWMTFSFSGGIIFQEVH